MASAINLSWLEWLIKTTGERRRIGNESQQELRELCTMGRSTLLVEATRHFHCDRQRSSRRTRFIEKPQLWRERLEPLQNCFAIQLRSIDRRIVALLGGFKFFLELPIPFILRRVTDVDLVASRIRVEVVGFPILLRDCYFIGAELLLLDVGSDRGSKPCGRKQVLCLLRTSTAYGQR